MKFPYFWVCALFTLIGCSQQSSLKGAKSQEASVSSPNPNGDALPGAEPLLAQASKKCDFTKDFVEISFPKKIEECNVAGNIWDFSRSVCSSVGKAKSFECSFLGFLAAMEKMGTLDERVKQNQDKGAKLVACGEKEGVILAQWYIPTNEQRNNSDCSAGNAKFVTACFTNKNSAQRSEVSMVADCLK